jgi:ABC-type tungstate transport system substrate-binding protein
MSVSIYLIAWAVGGILYATGSSIALERGGARALVSATVLALLVFNVLAYLDWRRDPEVVFSLYAWAVSLPTVVVGALAYLLRRRSRLGRTMRVGLASVTWAAVAYATLVGMARW